jgi:O-antigen biosynthesis protein
MPLDEHYVMDRATGVWMPLKQRRDFDYSDGDTVEEFMLQAVRESADRSSASDELACKARDWPSEYHFSPARGNLLRPFDLSGRSVLEIGAGCGALTRYLADAGATVVALEGSSRRAAIAAERCAGLTNVTIVCDELADFRCDSEFDVVLIVGVLEYAPRFFAGPRPEDALLQRAVGFLSPTGVVVVAIENQLGLKYFAGSSEDHTGTVFYGVEDRYGDDDRVITFGRSELVQTLARAGLTTCRLYYPFPDYKMPKLIVSEAGISASRVDLGHVLSGLPSRDYSETGLHLFIEGAVWPVLVRNNLAADLSNSFLAVAGRAEGAPLLRPVPWFAKAFSTDRRKSYRTITTFEPADDHVTVAKERLHGDSPRAENPSVRLICPQQSRFVPGTSLQDRMFKAFLRADLDSGEVARLLRPWVAYLREHVQAGQEGMARPLLPGSFFDCVPRNFIEGAGEEEPSYIDAEWEYTPPMGIETPLVRGLLHLAIDLPVSLSRESMTVMQFILEQCERCDVELSTEDVMNVLLAERAWIGEVTRVDPASWLVFMESFISGPMPAAGSLAQELRSLQARVSEAVVALKDRDVALAVRDEHIRKLDLELARVIAFKDAQIALLEAHAAESASQTALTAAQIALLEAQVASFEAHLAAIEASASWRLTLPLRKAGSALGRGRRR